LSFSVRLPGLDFEWGRFRLKERALPFARVASPADRPRLRGDFTVDDLLLGLSLDVLSRRSDRLGRDSRPGSEVLTLSLRAAFGVGLRT
jgi:hypothetical protein